MEPKANDQIYVTGLGWGHVTRALPNGAGFFVKIGQTEKRFDSEGKIGGAGQRRAYWQDPVVAVPTSDARLWRAYLSVAQPLWERLRELRELGLLPDSEEGGQ